MQLLTRSRTRNSQVSAGLETAARMCRLLFRISCITAARNSGSFNLAWFVSPSNFATHDAVHIGCSLGCKFHFTWPVPTGLPRSCVHNAASRICLSVCSSSWNHTWISPILLFVSSVSSSSLTSTRLGPLGFMCFIHWTRAPATRSITNPCVHSYSNRGIHCIQGLF